MDVIAFNVVRRRKQLGLSQVALADAMREAGMDHWRQNTVSRIETGKQELTFREVKVLSQILGNITAGIDSFDQVRRAAGELRDSILSRKLQRAEASLVAALEEIRELRSVFDVTFEE